LNGQIYTNTTDHNTYQYLNGTWETWVSAALLGVANGVATLNASTLVIQDPANAVITPAADKIVKANSSGKIDNGWLLTGTGNGLDSDLLDGQHGTFYLARANHTGTQPASTISDFDAQVRTNRLDQMASPTASIDLNGQLITNYTTTPVNAYDVPNKKYVDDISQGLNGKTSVKVATTVNCNLTGEQTIDGVGVVDGDLVLVRVNTNPEENGTYIVKDGTDWIRNEDTDTWEKLISAFVFVEQGATLADSGWLCTIDAGGTLDTTAVTWVQFSQAGTVTASNIGSGSVNVFKQKTGTVLEFRTLKDTSSIDVTQNGDFIEFDVIPAGININLLGGGPLTVANGGTGATTALGAKTNLGFQTKHAEDIGDGTTKEFTINHNLNTYDVITQVYNKSTKHTVEPDIENYDANNVKINFNKAPTANQYRVVVIG